MIQVGKKLPEDLIDTAVEGISSSFSNPILFMLKLEGLNSVDIDVFNNREIKLDLLELNMFKDKIGSLYAFSVFIEDFIDNSEVLIDFRCEDLESIMKRKFEGKDGIKVQFVLADQDNNVLGLREFKLNAKFSNIISKCAYAQNEFVVADKDKDTDYVVLAFQKIFENEPEENVKLYSIGRN